MTKIRALKCFSDGTLSMYVGEIRNVDDAKATEFIAGGLAEAYTDPIVPTGTKQITSNGTGIDVAEYADVDVAVPQPEGNINLTENGENIDVAQYATASVAVPQPTGNLAITQNGDNIDVSQYATVSVHVE